MQAAWRIIVALGVLGVASGANGRASAFEGISLFQYKHEVIAPAGERIGAITRLAQDRDGFLWMTTFAGRLLRYDGLTLSEPFAEQLKGFSGPTVILLGTHGESSDIWLGHRRNGATHIVNGVATHFEGSGLPPGTVFSLARDNDGVVWLMTPVGVARFLDGKWQPLPNAMGWKNQHPEGLAVERGSGDIYVADAEQGALMSKGGREAFQPVSRAEFDRVNAQLPKGATWSIPPEQDGPSLLASDGSLWVGPYKGVDRFIWPSTPPNGVPHVRQNFSVAQGLSGSLVNDILEDQEGDIWVGTDGGLDRFTVPRFLPYVLAKEMTSPSITPMADGSMWFADTGNPPSHLVKGQITTITALKDGVSAVLADADGSLLFAGVHGLRRWKKGVVQFQPVPPELAHAGTRFHQMLGDGAGNIYVIATTFGFYRIGANGWMKLDGLAGFPKEVPLVLAPLADGSLGVAYEQGGLYAIRNGRPEQILGGATGLQGTTLTWLSKDLHNLVGGTANLITLDHGVMHAIRRADGAAFEDVTGLALDGGGSLWVRHRDGVDRILPQELERVAAGGGDVHSLHIGNAEGLGENPAGFPVASSIVVSPDGKIWTASGNGIAYLPPNMPTKNTVQPHVFVEAVWFDRKRTESLKGVEVPPSVHSLRIDYTSPMLRSPERVSFEYQLSDVDEQWQGAGGRRSAYYNNLPPGIYTFRVRAFNEDGVRSSSDAEIKFIVEAAWYQTKGFASAVVICLGCLALGGYLIHLRTINRRWRIRMDERERIARELHDTLLQGFQALVYRLHAAHREGDPSRTMDAVQSVLVTADTTLIEARDAVTSLRESDAMVPVEKDFLRALEMIVADWPDSAGTRYLMESSGFRRALRASVQRNILAIAREAVINAIQHANAHSIRLKVDFGRRGLQLTVRDDGKGMSLEVKRGHWGMRGMEERAHEIGAKLVVSSASGQGTVVSLRVSASKAYI